MPEEEAVANAQMIRSFWGRRYPGKTTAIRKFVLEQGPGYRDGDRVSKRSCFSDAVSELSRLYACVVSKFADDVLEVSELDGAMFFPSIPADWRYCPIHLVDDHKRLGMPTCLLDFLQSVTGITETERFGRSLQKTPKAVQRKWETTKQRLATTVAGSGTDFKFWSRDSEGTVYSLRMSRNHRAHLRHLRDSRRWLAVDVGTHSQMGHG